MAGESVIKAFLKGNNKKVRNEKVWIIAYICMVIK